MKLLPLICLLFGLSVSAETIKLTADNHVLIRTEIDDTSVSKAQVELASKVLKRGFRSYKIYLVLDSPGGSIDSGLSFIEFAKTIPNLETVTLFAASMASAIVEALPGKRHVIESGIYMFHRARGGVEGQFEDGELESRLNLYKKIVRNMEITNANRMGMSLELYKAQVKDELWILGSEAVAKKAADSVVNLECSQDLINSKTIETFNVMGLFEVQVQFSDCPLIRGGEAVQPANGKMYREWRSQKWSAGVTK
jgi:ATP-dependent protease ClpP protease subunit